MSKISGTAKEPRDILREDIQDLARCVTTRNSLCVRRKNWKILVPPCRKVESLHQFNFGREIGKLFAVNGEQLHPLRSGVLAAFANALFEMPIDGVGHEEFRIFGPAVKLFDQADLLVTKRFTVRFDGVLSVQ